MDRLPEKRIKQGAGLLALIAVIAFIAGLYVSNTTSYPTFSSDSSKTSGWWSSENENMQKVAKSAGSSYRGTEPIDKLPVADLTIHHGEKGTAMAPEDSCFTAFSYYDYPLDGLDAAYGEYKDRKEAQGVLKELEPRELTIKTFEGDEKYTLRQYDYTIEGEDVLSGYQVGFIELNDGYVRVEGVCKTAKDLALNLPIFESVSLNEP